MSLEGDSQEPTGLPCIVPPPARPFPPPRARPFISGVVDIVGYAPVFFTASTGFYRPQAPGGYRPGEGRNFRSHPGFSSHLRHPRWQEQAMNWDRVKVTGKNSKGRFTTTGATSPTTT